MFSKASSHNLAGKCMLQDKERKAGINQRRIVHLFIWDNPPRAKQMNAADISLVCLSIKSNTQSTWIHTHLHVHDTFTILQEMNEHCKNMIHTVHLSCWQLWEIHRSVSMWGQLSNSSQMGPPFSSCNRLFSSLLYTCFRHMYLALQLSGGTGCTCSLHHVVGIPLLGRLGRQHKDRGIVLPPASCFAAWVRLAFNLACSFSQLMLVIFILTQETFLYGKLCSIRCSAEMIRRTINADINSSSVHNFW